MHDEYLWHGAGGSAPADPEIVALERTLAPLRFEARPLLVPPAQPTVSRERPWLRWAVPLLASAAAAVLVLSLRGSSEPVVVESQPAGSPREPQAQAVLGPEPSAAEPSDPAPKKKTPAKRAAAKTKPAKPAAAKTKPAKPAKPAPAKKQKKAPPKTPVSVDCILDPAKCEPLPRTLTAAQIRKGVQTVRGKVVACGRKHPVDAVARIKVKMSVAGETGRVTSATALAPWKDTELGTCITAALSTIRFPRFLKSTLGVMYPVTIDPGRKPSEPESTAPRKSSEAAILRRAAPTLQTKARACAVAHDAKLGTRLDVTVTVSAEGAVQSVRLAPRGPLSKDVRHCLTTAIQKTAFDRSPKGLEGKLSLSL